jgi:hypothetical protein
VCVCACGCGCMRLEDGETVLRREGTGDAGDRGCMGFAAGIFQKASPMFDHPHERSEVP